MRRFVIVTQGRAGSELLVELLRSQPGVRCDGELLARRSRFPGWRVRIAAAGSMRPGARARAYGWKLVSHQHPDPVGFVRWLSPGGWLPVVLSRRNLLAQGVSALRARAEGQWHHRDAAPAFKPVTLDPEVVVAQLVIMEGREAELAKIAAAGPSLSLVYEDDLAEPASHAETVERVMATLGLAAAPVRSEVLRRPPRPLSESIANYEAVADLLRHTRFAHFLED